jgi:hypothetical protein
MYLLLDHGDSQPAVEAVMATTTGEAVAATTTATSTAAAKREEPFEASLEELMLSGGNYGCHYTSPPEEGDFVGTIYVSSGRARGTVVGEAMGPGTIISFLFNEEHVYIWYAPGSFGDMQGASLLMEATTTKDKSETRHNVMDNLTDLYGCVSWEFEDGFFELPDDILFIKPEDGWER